MLHFISVLSALHISYRYITACVQEKHLISLITSSTKCTSTATPSTTIFQGKEFSQNLGLV